MVSGGDGGVLVQENLCDESFLAEHVNGVDAVREVLRDIRIGACADRCGVDEELLRTAARRIASADSVAVFEDLGIQQAPNSTLSSYLNKLLWILTGNFAKRGGQHLHSSFSPLFECGVGRTPVTGAPIIAGLVPSNVVPQEILSDHPDRFRAMIVESSNPAHSLADSAACRAAFESLELMVVIDVAMTETARLAHYVLPAATQFEKPEATFFNLEFPRNTFQLRHPLLEPFPGTLAEPEIWARLVRALGVVDDRAATTAGRRQREPRSIHATFRTAVGTNPMFAKVVPFVLYETLGPTLPGGLAGAAALWGLAQKAASPIRRRFSRWSCRRQRAVRCDLAEPLWSDLHGARLRGRLPADQRRGSQDRPRHARNARRDKCATRRQTCPDKS